MKPIGNSPFPGFGASFPELESDSKPSEAGQVVFLGTSSMGWSKVSSPQSASDSNTTWIFFPIVESTLIHRWGRRYVGFLRTTDAFYINPHPFSSRTSLIWRSSNLYPITSYQIKNLFRIEYWLRVICSFWILVRIWPLLIEYASTAI